LEIECAVSNSVDQTNSFQNSFIDSAVADTWMNVWGNSGRNLLSMLLMQKVKRENAVKFAQCALYVSILTSLLACGEKHYINTKYGFEPVELDTPIGALTLRVEGLSRKVAKTEWVTESPWQLIFLIRSNNNVEKENCQVVIDNISLMKPSIVANSVVEFEARESQFLFRDKSDISPAAVFVSNQVGFDHQDYAFSLTVSARGDCETELNNHKIESVLKHTIEVSRASLWDNLMAI